ncbi:MAG: ChbG/HpnK family deacetylase [Methylophilus sp.]|nr:ChbG/HpnK family deacetylase [Methylophilus sp.]
MMRQLIVCADDFAQSEEIDSAIIALIEKNRLTATSCLTLSPRWLQASGRITPAIRDKAAIGLHLDFTQYAQPKRSLPKLIMCTYLRLLSTQKIKAAIHSQLDAFEHALNMPPDYIDGHQHVHQLPQIRDALVEILCQRYPQKKPWIRIAKPPMQDGIKAVVIGQLGSHAIAALAERKQIQHSQTLLGVYGFKGNLDQYQHKLNQWFAQMHHQTYAQSSVLMCHPSLKSLGIRQEDAIYQAREIEYQALSSSHFLTLLQQHNIQLAKDIHASSQSI